MQTRHTKLAFSILAVLALAKPLFSIVIVPPIVYFASLSIGTFLANSLIALAALAAVAGAANWKIFNKPFPAIVSACFSFASTIALGVASMLLAALLFSPRNWEQILAASVAAFSMSFALFFLRGYREFRAGSGSIANRLAPVFLVSLLFALLFVPCVFSAIEFRQMQLPQAQGAPMDAVQQAGIAQTGAQQSEIAQPFGPGGQKTLAPSMAASQGQQVQNGTGQAGAGQEQKALAFWLIPQSGEPCIVEISGQRQEYAPEKGCAYEPSPAAKLEYCPIWISVPGACSNDVNVTATGSCQQLFNLQCRDSMLQLSN